LVKVLSEIEDKLLVLDEDQELRWSNVRFDSICLWSSEFEDCGFRLQRWTCV